ncbi:uncharacterized protein LOC123318606 [Coccinella septempunctata]|uniref:uncharacterized protein LOC123318606 n=1 Tax=Coccinella septempunctata TaxID=41139 RepID=UPI001D07DF29|nr:uncharacterized protein LOC123318606 [Coccinella septempunctata]
MEEEVLKWGKMDHKGILSKVVKKYNPKLKGRYQVDTQALKGYVSGSIYAGEWSPVEMDGEGSYILPHGVVYEGKLKDGMFHGKGVLTYPLGQMVVGEWYEGDIISWTFKYKNIKQCTLDTYCKQPDRRFLTTLYNELLPAGKEYLTNQQPTRKIPTGCYDVEDGFYNPKTLWVHSVKNMSKVLYMPPPRRKPADLCYFRDEMAHFIRKVPFVPIYRTSQWIEENCRKAWDQPTEYKPELYEYWYSGRKDQARRLNMRVQKQGGKFHWQESVCDELLRNFEIVAERQRRRKQEKMEEETVEKEAFVPKMEQLEVKFASIAITEEPTSLWSDDRFSLEVQDSDSKKFSSQVEEGSDQPQ